ncbi:MAG TPA: GMC family oxidoreductase [Ilumatobacteraceae bacterium]|nr:GMC family oxidoreductase [Ilumatobacteraceae bacterium]
MAGPWIVVGAGTAGCVVAARLSEDPDRHVMLLESGPDLAEGAVPPEIDADSFFGAADLPDRNDGGVQATRTAGGAVRPYRRGRGLGGSSVVNAMVALRGDSNLYRSWGWDDVDAAWSAMTLPEELPNESDLGPIDRALMAAAADARRVPLTRRDGRRITSAEAYLWPARTRPNLAVRVDVTVERVVLDGRRAVGVVLSTGEEISAERVVLSAGAIRTPALLLRSGFDTPGIGRCLQDHPSAPLTLALRDGVPADPAGLVIGTFCQRNGVQFLPMNHLGADAPHLGMMLVTLLAPRSRSGTVRLDPLGEPLVDFALLADPGDLRALGKGVAEAVSMLATAPFAEVVDQVYVDDSGTTIDALGDVASIERWLPTALGDCLHASGSCAMGSVVDADGALVGYESVYICDASVFPSIPDANTHLPTTMLAERLTARWCRRHP